MKALLLCIFLGFCAFPAGPLFAQTPSKASAAKDRSNSARQESAVKLKTQLVQVRALVTDKSGKPITGLTKDNFEVLEDGRPQQISFFSAENVSGSTSLPEPQPSTSRTAASHSGTSAKAEAANPSPNPSAGRTVVLFVDTLNMSATSLLNAKQALRRFVDEKLMDNDRVSIVATSGSLGLLSEFTNNKTILHYAIDRLAAWRAGETTLWTPFLAAKLLAGDPFALDLGKDIVCHEEHLEGLNLPADFFEREATSKAREVINDAVGPRRIALLTLKAVVEGLSRVQGPRAVAVISDGFTLNDESGHMDFTYLQGATSEAARLGVVVYTILARGLEPPPIMDATQTILTAPGLSSGCPQPKQNTPAAISQYLSASRVDDKNVLTKLAADTGGEAFLDTNDMVGSIQKMLDSTGFYYSLAYYPPESKNSKDDKRFRSISVKVRNHPEYVVRAQKGYVPFESEKQVALDASLTPGQRLVNTMAEPLAATDIGVDSSADFFEQEGDQSQIRLYTYLSGKNLNYQPDNDRYQFKLEVVTRILNETGTAVFGHSETVSGDLTVDHLEAARRNGFSFTKKLALKPGLYEVTIGAIEDSTGKIGTSSCWIDVPDLTKKRLTMSSILVGANQTAADLAAAGSFNETATSHGIRFFATQDKLTYTFRVYNLPPDTGRGSGFQMQLELVRGSETVTKTDWSSIATHETGTDKLGITVGGEVPTGDIKPGVYELRILIRDSGSKRSLQSSSEFGIS